jgi:hypothetical protein
VDESVGEASSSAVRSTLGIGMDRKLRSPVAMLPAPKEEIDNISGRNNQRNRRTEIDNIFENEDIPSYSEANVGNSKNAFPSYLLTLG